MRLNPFKWRWKWILTVAAIVFVILQFIHPVRPDASASGLDLLATNAPPPEIAALLRNACYDCHSLETKWPWYSRVAPVSWWLNDHINDARKRLNFSDWPHDDPRRAAKKWRHMRDEVESGTMPLPSYTWMHADARLSPAQRQQFVAWAGQEADRLGGTAEEPAGGEADKK